MFGFHSRRTAVVSAPLHYKHMMLSLTLLSAIAVAVVSARDFRSLWNDDCNLTVNAFLHANASGKYQIPAISITNGTQSGNSNPSYLLNPSTSNWTVYDTVYRYEASPGNFVNDQFFWLDALRRSQPADEPLIGCVIGLQGIPDDLVKKAQDDPGDCSSMLDSDCISDLKVGLGGIDSCDMILGAEFPNCKKYGKGADGSFWSVTVSRGNIQNLKRICIDKTTEIELGPRRPTFNCSAANSLPLPLLETGTGYIYGDNSADNFTYYDREVSNVTPLILSFFNNQSTTSNSFHQAEMLCLRPKTIAAGSRDPSTGAASRQQVGGVVIGIVLVVMTFLM
jgi:hypothetical protein